MQLTLAILRCPDAATPEVRRSSGADLTIGRGAESDWTLPDPDRVLSKRHCTLEYRGGYWQVRDLSINGTFVNHAHDPVGRDLVVPLNDGDRLRLGGYELEVRLDAGASTRSEGWGAPALGTPLSLGGGRAAPDPFAEPLRAPLPTAVSPGGGLPADFDPFAEEGPMPDHQPAASDAFLAPRVSHAALPDDWGADLDLGQAARPTPTYTRPPTAAAPGIPDDWDLRLDAPPPAPPTVVAKPAPPPPTLPPPPRAAPQPPPPAQEDPFTEVAAAPAAPPPVAAPPAPPDTAPPPVGADAALAALLRGAGLSALPPGTDPAAVLEAAGSALRAATNGLRALLIARADVKREFRIEQTMLRVAGNNPLKFAATDDAAMLALLTSPNGARAVAETVGDLTTHEVATLAATQAAARALLSRLAPDGLEADTTSGGMFGGREKRLWEAYRRLHTTMTAQFEDDFDSAFGKAFARAYESAARRD